MSTTRLSIARSSISHASIARSFALLPLLVAGICFEASAQSAPAPAPAPDPAPVHPELAGVYEQFGGAPGNPPTGTGWPSYYLEEYVGMSQVFQTQILNLVVEGVFDHFPNLRIAMIESGWTWLPSLLWRIDKDWKGLRREVPWVRRLPSEYVREHVRLTIQPFDTPVDPDHSRRLLDQFADDGLLDLLMFATDYPHWDFDAPDRALPNTLPAELKRKILAENARAFYRF